MDEGVIRLREKQVERMLKERGGRNKGHSRMVAQIYLSDYFDLLETATQEIKQILSPSDLQLIYKVARGFNLIDTASTWEEIHRTFRLNVLWASLKQLNATQQNALVDLIRVELSK